MNTQTPRNVEGKKTKQLSESEMLEALILKYRKVDECLEVLVRAMKLIQRNLIKTEGDFEEKQRINLINSVYKNAINTVSKQGIS